MSCLPRSIALSLAIVLLDLSLAYAAEPQVLAGHKNVVSAVAFSPDGKRLISASWDRTLRAWDVSTGRQIGTLKGHRDWVLDVAFEPGGKQIVTASQHTVRTWSPNSFEGIEASAGLGGAAVNTVALTVDGAMVATGGRDGSVKIWRVGEQQPTTSFGGVPSWVNVLAFAPNAKTVIAGSRTGEIHVFDLQSKKEQASMKAHAGKQVLALAVNPASDTLASGGFDASIQLWDLATGKAQAKLTGHKGVVTAVAWSPDGRLLASGERHGEIKLWNIATGHRLVATLPGHSDKRLGFSVTALTFSHDGRLLASGSYDKTVKIWSVPEE